MANRSTIPHFGCYDLMQIKAAKFKWACKELALNRHNYSVAAGDLNFNEEYIQANEPTKM